ncbi:quinone oxidoreductase [Bosea sp. F3-2]|uniref:quinone oxidoreductase family protein n=1 Tax=Bosea sp. F3-2 TaxID=2599640 RepID=UPI0011F00722|nr:quinone oxidoreductase [Bosea sp. F3-2]QEL23752.1 quinone oxidoreductase [Bosea sp. F3-2]
MKTAVMTAVGGTDVLKIVERPDAKPGPGEIAVDVAASGVNFMDIGIRRGMLEVPLPHAMGVEGAGRIVELGEGVTGLTVGQRVAWVYVPGSYAERVVGRATSFVPLPDFIDDRTAASLMMQGLTASHFATDFYPVQEGDIALVHAAAGGVGQLLSQIIKMRGGIVIGRVSSEAKVAAAKAAGADHVIVDAEGAFAEEAIRLSGGEGVHVVFDGSGPATFEGSLAALRRSGTFCWFGPVLGSQTTVPIMSLPKSIKLGYAVFFDHIYTPELLRSRTLRLFEWVREGRLRISPATSFALSEVETAHSAIESRATTGKLLLIP